jgi:phage tail-like protein
MATARKNPYSAFNFVVTLDGNEIAAFMEVSGLDGGNAIIEYREGHDQTGNGGAFVRKLPGLESYPNVMLRRGIAGDLTLWNLRQAIRDATSGPEFGTVGSATPSLKVELQDETHTTVQSWTMHNAWLAKLSGPSMNAKGNEIAIEAVEFVCERIEIS